MRHQFSRFILTLLLVSTFTGCTTGDVTFRTIDSETLKPLTNIKVTQEDRHYTFMQYLLGWMVFDLIQPEVDILNTGKTDGNGVVAFRHIRYDVGKFYFETPTNAPRLELISARWDWNTDRWKTNTSTIEGDEKFAQIVNGVVVIPCYGPTTCPSATSQ